MNDTPEEPIRILSDLHFGHPACIIERPSQLEPLFQGVRSVVFNGDTVEVRYVRGRRIGMRNAGKIRDAALAAGVVPYFINGNHDPMLSNMNHLDLADGAVLVTHGDMLFHQLSPWSHHSRHYAEAHRRELEGLGPDLFLDFETRLRAMKRAALAVELHRPRMKRDAFSWLRTVLRECWPPWRPLQVFYAWAVTPARAVAMARVFRPQARFILVGHTHFCGHWRRGPRVVINTGSFLPLSGRMAVDIANGMLTVRPIVMERGMFKAGAPMMEFEAKKLLPPEGY